MAAARQSKFFNAILRRAIRPSVAILVASWLWWSPLAPARATPPNHPVDIWPNTQTPRAAAVALYWLAKHQSPQGNWSLQKYTDQCTDKSCTGAAKAESLSAATAFGLLPLLGAGQYQTVPGPFTGKVASGIKWLIGHQKADGDLSSGDAAPMYAHSLATVVLCEDFSGSHDKTTGDAAQKAVDLIIAGQNAKTGEWRYRPAKDGNMLLFGWQLTALESARLAGLKVPPAAFDGAKKWLHTCSVGGAKLGQFSLQPRGEPAPLASAIGLISNEYLGAKRTDPVVVGGAAFLMANLPNSKSGGLCYRYFATQAMHGLADKDWNTWRKKINAVLVESQSRTGCASGSWDPEKPSDDAWGSMSGRIMQTSLNCLTLEVYYRYLTLYQLDKSPKPAAGGKN